MVELEDEDEVEEVERVLGLRGRALDAGACRVRVLWRPSWSLVLHVAERWRLGSLLLRRRSGLHGGGSLRGGGIVCCMRSGSGGWKWGRGRGSEK